MLLTVDTVTPYLANLGLIDSRDIVEGDLTVSALMRRNFNLRVTSSLKRGLFLKQPESSDEGAVFTTTQEARFYSFCQSEATLSNIQALMPRLIVYIAEDHLLISSLIAGALPLWHFYPTEAVSQPAWDLGAAVGLSLGELHAAFVAQAKTTPSPLEWLGRAKPWAFQSHRPTPSLLARLSTANVRTIQIVQKHLSAYLSHLDAMWIYDTIIHGDAKSDNFLVPSNVSSAEGGKVAVVDWEFTQIGDSAWDVGTLIQDTLIYWLRSLDLGHASSPEDAVRNARWHFARFRPLLNGFLSGYFQARGNTLPDAEDFLNRAVTYSGVRLIQTASEFANQQVALPNTSIIMLQIAENILSDPPKAATDLYGIAA